jgi:hypothetical protein
MRTYQYTTFTVLDRYDILYGGYRSDSGVGSGRRRQFLDSNVFRFSTTLRNVIVIELRDSFVFSVRQTFLSMFDVYCGYGFAHTFPHLNYVEPFCILHYPSSSFARFEWVEVRLG